MKVRHSTISEDNPDIPYDELCKQFKYKIYARKSTEDSGRQVRSIEDQIADCKALAEKLGLTVVGEPIREERSAMEPDNRPLFDDLLKELKKGDIDGIIAWHPDRLARNSIESGRIIEMLDTHEIKDLRFHSHQFSNDPNGKMLLGMLFVFAKHYSDDLGFKVRRGVRNRFREGKSGGTPKHGYIQHNGIYQPDHHGNDNFNLIRNAWKLRLAGQSYEAISSYLVENGYEKHYHPEDKASGGRIDEWRKLKMDDSTLSRMFRDPFYYGVLVQDEQEVDLRDPSLGLDFTTVVSETEFLQVQDLTPDGKHKKGKKQKFMPCRNRIYCAVCHDKRAMSVYETGKNKNYYAYFRCQNPNCPRRKANIRAYVILNAIEEVLPHVISNLSSSAYETYLKETKELSRAAKVNLRSKNTSNRAKIKHLRDYNNKIAEQLSKLTDKRAVDDKNKQIANNYDEIDRLQREIKENEKKLSQSENVRRYTKEEFNSMLKNALELYRKGSVVRKDLLLREIFSNFYFDQEKIVGFSVIEPFATLLGVKTDDVVALGGGREIRTPAPGFPRLTI